MKTLRFSLHLSVVALVVLVFSSVASAQATRTWVSGVGDDANPCSRTAPCKTWAGAISKTAAGGEIDCLDPGGFGGVTITKSITIDCDTTGWGGSVVAGTNGIVISAQATDIVTLRALHLNGLCAAPGAVNCGLDGVKILTAKTVHLIELDIWGFGQNGVEVSSTSAVNLTVENSYIHDNTGACILTNGSAGVFADIYGTSLSNCAKGIDAQNGSRLQVHSSTIFANTIGVNQSSVAGLGSQVNVFATAFTNNGTAMQAAGGGSEGVSDGTFTANTTIFNSNGGSIVSNGNNINFGNTANGTAPGVITKI